VPLYDYRCEAGHRYEKRESFGSPPLQPCEKCGKPARRVLNAPPLVFKGGGWYKTAGRKPDSAESSSSGSSGNGSSEAKAEKAEKKASPKKKESSTSDGVASAKS
jgi:putative FmdB family regulatory protein